MDSRVLAQIIFARQNRRHLGWMALILLACLVFFTVAGWQALPGTDTIYKREIVSDNADAVTPPLLAGGEIKQMIYVQGPLYGVTLHPATGGRALQGTLQVELMEHFQTATLFATSLPLSQLAEDTPLDVVFDGMVDASTNGGENGVEGGTWYCLRITAQPSTPADAPAFYKSDGFPKYYFDANLGRDHYSTLGGFTLDTGEGWVQEMLALQYLIDVTGPFLPGPYCFFAAFLTVLLLVLYMLLFVLARPPHQIFVVCALGLGLVFMFLIPPRAAPDEYAHISAAYHYTNRLLGTAAGDDFGSLWVRAGDEMKLWNYDSTAIGIFAYRDLAQNLFAWAPGGVGGPIPARVPSVFFGQLAVPALGVFFARLAGVGRVGLLLLGRLFNLGFYAVVVSRAIKRMPFAKLLLFSAGLLPMALQLAASFSYDTYVMAIGFYLTACCLEYRYNKKPVRWRQIALLAGLCLLLAPAKSVYIPMLLLLFLIKPSQFASKKACYAVRGGILCAGALLWLVFTASSLLVSVGAQAAPEKQATQAMNAPAAQTAEPARGTQTMLAATPAKAKQTILVAAHTQVAQAMQPVKAQQPAQTLYATQAPGALQAALRSTKMAAPPPEVLRSAAARLAAGPGLAYAAAVPANTENTNLAEDYKGALAPNGDAVQLYDALYIVRHIPQTMRILLRTVWFQGPLWLQGVIGGRLGEVIAVNIEVRWALVAALAGVLLLSIVCDPQDRRLLLPRHRLGFVGIALATAGAAVLAALTWTPVNYLTIFGIQGRYLLPVLPLLLLALRGRNVRFTRPAWQKLAFAQVVLVILCQVDAFGTILQLPT